MRPSARRLEAAALASIFLYRMFSLRFLIFCQDSRWKEPGKKEAALPTAQVIQNQVMFSQQPTGHVGPEIRSILTGESEAAVSDQNRKSRLRQQLECFFFSGLIQGLADA